MKTGKIKRENLDKKSQKLYEDYFHKIYLEDNLFSWAFIRICEN